jgi:UDPglucose 6-dehydrogenase
MANARREQPDLDYAESMVEAVTDADLVCVLTAWEEFRYADPKALAGIAHGLHVIDGPNCLEPPLWTAAGWNYRGMGRPNPA